MSAPALVRLECPTCHWSPGEFLPGAQVTCCGGNRSLTDPHHRARYCVATNPLPLTSQEPAA